MDVPSRVGQAGDVRYAAFISYSHKDAAFGRWLHRRLEGYRLPRRLAGRDGERGPVPARLTPIFRDREELPAAGDLSERVRAALAISGALIVVCSPNSAASPWVGKEIATFRLLHPESPIFAAILDGEPAQCFPPDLRQGAEGEIEPLAADFRKEGDGRRLAILKLVSGIAGIGLDQLVQRDAQRRIRRVMAVTLAALIGMLVTATMAFAAITARAKAQRQRQEAEGLVEFMLTDLRDRLKGVGRLDVLTSVNQRALDYYQKQDISRLPVDSLERRARILRAMGEDDSDRGKLDRALVQFREAQRTTNAALAEKPGDPARVFDEVQSAYWIAHLYEQRGDFAAALGGYEQYLRYAVELNKLAQNRPDYVAELGYAETNLGIVYLNGLTRPPEARRHFEQSIRWFTMAARLDPGNRKRTSDLANTRAWLADAWFRDKNLERSRAERLKEKELKEAVLRDDPNNLASVYALIPTNRSLARIAYETRDLSQAKTQLVALDAQMSKLSAKDPDNAVWREQAVRIHIDLARVAIAAHQAADASRSLAMARRLLDDAGRPETIASASRTKLKATLSELQSLLENMGG